MKLNDVKHNHSLTDLLKILLFSILMMIPFIDVGVRCAYVVCNKNAYQSYSDTYIEDFNRVNNNTLMIDDNDYLLKISKSDVQSFSQNFTIKFNNISIDIEEETGYPDINMIQYQNSGFISLQINGHESKYYSFNDPMSDLFFGNIYFNNNNTSYYNFLNNNLFVITYKEEPLDNVFDYSVNKLTTSELYTWTQQTAIYTGVQTMCVQLGINNTVIPILFVYWFILTVIYIIVDIVIKLFTLLTHSIGSKTA